MPLLFNWIILTIFVKLPVYHGHDVCPEGAKVRAFDIKSEPSPSIFDDLTVDEMNSVNDFMKSRDEFDIKEGSDATVNSTYIFNIEGLHPVKAEALSYLDKGGPRPARYAWVVLYRGDQDPPVIEDYKVGPLSNVNTYTKIDRLGRPGDLEYYRRSAVSYADLEASEVLIEREMAKIDDYLEDLTGYRYVDCEDHCLNWELGDTQYKKGEHKFWITVLRDVEGLYLHPMGLEFRVDTRNELDDTKWIVDFVWFRGKTYGNFEEMLEKVETPNNSKKEIFEDDEQLFSSLNQRGDPVPKENQRGPRCFMPDGRRFTVEGHHIEWQGWSFDFNMKSITGLQVHDARFKNERIAYELGLSEIAVLYTSGSPTLLHSAFLDSTYSLGRESLRMTTGVTCPDYSEYFDFAHFYNFKPHLQPKSVCLFEHQRDVPLRYHIQTDWEGSYSYLQGMPGNVLILRTVITIAYYEYIMDYVFHQNGALEIKITLSGYILTAWFDKNSDARSGFEVAPNVMGVIHNHLMHLKLDLDIISKENRFETLDLELDEVPNPIDGEPPMMRQIIKRNLRETELNATYKYDFDTPKYLVFHNKDAKNRVGNERGYRLLAGPFSKQLLPTSWAIEKAFSWARYQVAVTKQKDHEIRASSAQSQGKLVPVVDFEDFFNDDESLVDEDLVAWVTLGTFHIPHSDDVPIVQTPGMSLTAYLLPYNFFNQDPSLASRDNIRVDNLYGEPDDVTYHGQSMDVTCSPRMAKNVTGYGMKETVMKRNYNTVETSSVTMVCSHLASYLGMLLYLIA